jgi:hypothetical protein
VSTAICFVARTGIVMGTDSRVTTKGPEGTTREDAYPKLVAFGHAPVALAMVGAGAYGGRDFRSLVGEAYRSVAARALDMTVEQIAQTFAQSAGVIAREAREAGEMSVMVAGYSPHQHFGELWEVSLPAGKVDCLAAPGSQTFAWRGRADAIKTLWWGANLDVMHRVLEQHGLSHEQAHAVMNDVKKQSAWGPERIAWGMPLGSAVDLVRFQLETQIQSERFLPGRAACGFPIQLLAVNDAGLHWVERPFEAFSQVGRT